MSFKEIPAVKDQIMKCVRCGQCRSVCPVFAQVRNETAAPRGHVFMTQMLRDEKVDPSLDIYERISKCLMCETCTVSCPSKIPVHELNAAARSYIYEKNRSKIKDMVFDNFWANPGSLKRLVTLIGLTQKTGLQTLARIIGLTKLLPGDLPEAEQILQEVPSRSARHLLPEYNKCTGEKKYTVGYFLGCGTDLLNPQIAQATVKVLTNNGCDVIIPRETKCCGLPHLANGKKNTAAELARHNLEVFKKYNFDYIITDCASCSAALSKKHLNFVLHGLNLEEEIEAFTSKIIDLSKFLVDIIDIKIKENPNQPPIKVTYHDPCHLANAQGIKKEPRELLKRIPNLEFVEMKNANSCCGGSGTYSLTHYQLSMKILDKKIKNIRDTGAQIIATCCPSCIIQLKHGIRCNDMKAQVLHPIEILGNTYN